MKTVEAIRKEIEELEIKIEELESEQADCDYGGFEYDSLDAEIQYLYGSLDKAFVKLDRAKRVW